MRFNWFNREEKSITNPAVQPPARTSNPVVSPRRAMTLESVYRALEILENAAKQLTIDAWKNGVPMDSAPSLIRKPNAFHSQMNFVVETVASLAQRGNAYWLIMRGGSSGKILNLDVLPPLEVTPNQDPVNGLVTYTYGGRIYGRNEIMHLRLLTVSGQVEGLGPIQAAAASINGAIDLAHYANDLVNGGGIPSGILTSDQAITSAQAEETRKEWNATQGLNKGPAVLGKGTKYQLLALKPEEIQFLETQQFNITQIARLFGIPARLMLAPVEGSSTTYANAEQEDLQFVKWSLMGYLREIEDALTWLLPHGQVARFNVDALLRTDTLNRYTAHKTGINAGFLTIAEVRAIEGLPPLSEQVPDPEQGGNNDEAGIPASASGQI